MSLKVRFADQIPNRLGAAALIDDHLTTIEQIPSSSQLCGVLFLKSTAARAVLLWQAKLPLGVGREATAARGPTEDVLLVNGHQDRLNVVLGLPCLLSFDLLVGLDRLHILYRQLMEVLLAAEALEHLHAALE